MTKLTVPTPRFRFPADRVLRVNDAPAHGSPRDQEWPTSILLNVRYPSSAGHFLDGITRFVQAHLQRPPGAAPAHSIASSRWKDAALKATSGRLGLKTRRLRDAQEGLNLFRSLAKDNGIDPETFINSLGGEPSFSDCERSAQQFNS
jgi:hypothetical protein